MKRILLFLLIVSFAALAVQFRSSGDRTTFAELLQSARQQLTESTFIKKIVPSGAVVLRPRSLDPLELVPQDALLLFDTADAAAAGQAFSESRFGKTLHSVNWTAVLKQLDAPPLLMKMLQQQLANLKSLLNKPLLKDIFSHRTVIALLPPDDPQLLRSNPVQTSLAQTLLLVPGQKEEEAKKMLAQLRAKRKVKVVHYQGVAILTLDLKEDRKLHAAALGRHTVLSLSLPPLQKSIDLFISKKNNMLLNGDYAEMRKQAQGKEDFFLYANLFGLKSLIAQADPSASSSGTRSMSLFHYHEARTEHIKAFVRFSPKDLPPLQQRFYTAASLRNRNLTKMPADLLLYFWTSWLEPNFLQQTFLADKENETTAKVEAWFKKQSGMSLSAILSLFGQELSFNISEINTKGFFPVPRLCFILEVRKQKKAEALLKKLLSGLPVKREKIDGATVVSLQAAKGMMQPSYAFVDGFLILADSKEQLIDILSKENKKMVQDTAFQAVDTGMTQSSNLLLFARISGLVSGLQELAAWAGTVIAIQDQAAGAKSKVLVDEVISPLLDSLSDFETVSLRSHVQPGELVLETAALRAEKKQPKAAKK